MNGCISRQSLISVAEVDLVKQGLKHHKAIVQYSECKQVAEVDLVKQGLKLAFTEEPYLSAFTVAEVDLVKQGLKQLPEFQPVLFYTYKLQKSI